MESSSFLVPEEKSTLRQQWIVVLTLIAIGLLFIGWHFYRGDQAFTQEKQTQIQEKQAIGENLLYQSIVIDIQGAVNKPGLQHFQRSFDQPVRLFEALKRAGGLSNNADAELIAKTMNHASVLRDGQKIYFPSRGEQVSSKISGIQSININTASEVELDNLPGIGKIRAASIIENRPYTSLLDLKVKNRLPQSIVDKIKDSISF